MCGSHKGTIHRCIVIITIIIMVNILPITFRTLHILIHHNNNKQQAQILLQQTRRFEDPVRITGTNTVHCTTHNNNSKNNPTARIDVPPG